MKFYCNHLLYLIKYLFIHVSSEKPSKLMAFERHIREQEKTNNIKLLRKMKNKITFRP